jgi:hypothetical protein
VIVLVLGAAVASGALAPGAAPAADDALEDLLFDLQMIPLDGEAPPPLALPRVTDGAVMRLADLRGRAVLVYFWATW